MAKVTLKQGEAKTITFTVTDESGAAVNLSGATLTLGVKKARNDAAFAIEKIDADFGKSQAEAGVVTVILAEADTVLDEATYLGEIKAVWAGPPEVIEKSADFYLQIRGAVIPPA